MNKITYFRNRVNEQYQNANLADAAEAGEALLREHWSNQIDYGIPYANDMFNLALVYDDMGVWERALEMYAESARLVHDEEGDSLAFVSRMNNMAALLSRLGKTEHAYRMYAHMTAILRLCLNPAEPALADGIYNLANAAADVGRKEEAKRLHEEALRIRRKSGESKDAVHSLHSLAFLYEGEKSGERSLKYAKDAVSLAQSSLEGPDIPLHEVSEREHSYYSACFYLASLYENRGDFKKAQALYEAILDWTHSQGGDCHSAYLNVASRLANNLTNQKKYREALSIHQEIARNFKKTAGESHLFYANNLRNMALLHKKLNERDQTERLMLLSIKIRRTGVDDITADALFLIEMYLAGNQPDKALEMLVLVLMNTDEAQSGYNDTLNALAEAFARAGHTHLDTLPKAMEELCKRDKVQTIIQKWSKWGKDKNDD
jgi:tetratricopeptide (TPR) repeat protein